VVSLTHSLCTVSVCYIGEWIFLQNSISNLEVVDKNSKSDSSNSGISYTSYLVVVTNQTSTSFTLVSYHVPCPLIHTIWAPQFNTAYTVLLSLCGKPCISLQRTVKHCLCLSNGFMDMQSANLISLGNKECPQLAITTENRYFVTVGPSNSLYSRSSIKHHSFCNVSTMVSWGMVISFQISRYSSPPLHYLHSRLYDW